MKRFLYLPLFLFLYFSIVSAQTNDTLCGNNTPVPYNLPDGFSGDFNLQIGGATNPTLGQNGQAVCGIHLQFEHEYIGDLVMTLSSPSGQSVQLVGPAGFFGATDLNLWDIRFVPCNTPASPDPGFTAVWSNNQIWGIDRTYTGSYYPASGCLQDLTGPVNGVWTLHVTDAQAIDQGILYSFSIDFCDASGIYCNGCTANAGALTAPDVAFCSSSPELDLNLPPQYFNQPPPSAGEYGYTYLISRTSDDVLLEYDPDADLQGIAPAGYTVCGMSYRLGTDTLFPAPNGSLTTTQLRAQLNSSSAPFCAGVTSNCVNVVVLPEAADSVLAVTTCYPDCATFFGVNYCNTGTYIRTIYQDGCSYTATLVLTVKQPTIIQLFERICAGTCATTPGFENACSSGIYKRYIPSLQDGQCDSTIQLVLSVLEPGGHIDAPFTMLTCAADSLVLHASPSTGTNTWANLADGNTSNGNQYIVTAPGMYTLTGTITVGNLQCVRTDTVQVTSSPDAIEVYATAGEFGCGDTLVHLHADANGDNLSYQWSGPGGFESTLSNPDVSETGAYYLTVSNDEGCTGTASVEVTGAPYFLLIDVVNDSISCAHPEVTLQTSTNLQNATFSWSGPNTFTSTQASPSVTIPGTYTVTAETGHCSLSTDVVVTGNTELPVVESVVLVDPTNGQSNGAIYIEVGGAGGGPYSYVWILNNVGSTITEDIFNLDAGVYTCFIYSAANGCSISKTYTLSGNPFFGEQLAVGLYTIRNNPGSLPVLTPPFNGGMPVAQLRVYDNGGRLVWQQKSEEGATEQPIDLRHLPDGLYYLEVRDDAGIERFKLIKQQ